jgi:hypothetical protein
MAPSRRHTTTRSSFSFDPWRCLACSLLSRSFLSSLVSPFPTQAPHRMTASIDQLHLLKDLDESYRPPLRASAPSCPGGRRPLAYVQHRTFSTPATRPANSTEPRALLNRMVPGGHRQQIIQPDASSREADAADFGLQSRPELHGDTG